MSWEKAWTYTHLPSLVRLSLWMMLLERARMTQARPLYHPQQTYIPNSLLDKMNNIYILYYQLHPEPFFSPLLWISLEGLHYRIISAFQQYTIYKLFNILKASKQMPDPFCQTPLHWDPPRSPNGLFPPSLKQMDPKLLNRRVILVVWTENTGSSVLSALFDG